MSKHTAHQMKKHDKKAVKMAKAADKLTNASKELVRAANMLPKKHAATKVAAVASNLVNTSAGITKNVISIAKNTRTPTAIRAAKNALKATNRTAINAHMARREAAHTPK